MFASTATLYCCLKKVWRFAYNKTPLLSIMMMMTSNLADSDGRKHLRFAVPLVVDVSYRCPSCNCHREAWISLVVESYGTSERVRSTKFSQ